MTTDKTKSAGLAAAERRWPGPADPPKSAAAVVRECLELAVGVLDGPQPTEVEQIATAAAGWARTGVPVDTVLHTIHQGFELCLDRLVSKTAAVETGGLVAAMKVMVARLDMMSVAVTKAYFGERRVVAGEQHPGAQRLAATLLSGLPTSTMAREYGIAIAPEYIVLALTIPNHTDERSTLRDVGALRRRLDNLRNELVAHCGADVLALLSVGGGTILLPTTTSSDDDLDHLVASLSEAAGVAVTVGAVTAPVAEVPAAAERAHELLDMVERLQAPPKLYRFTELALEYQLTRPGPGREFLGSMLEPLDAHPELLETLQCHIGTNLNRRRTARALHIHANTVDYRLRRIGQLTGLDPTTASGLCKLRSAMIARTFSDRSPAATGPEADRSQARPGPRPKVSA
ncbi:PucR family transcriptional regulator [Nocardia sp. NPDC050406]|uniref:PucR family transcriptional regulator n=1 Tax=Nocardia sp. NPDC050406 TaxID=3364318 RepID=UPI0037A8E21F